jgi:hypothetical protein
MAVNLSAIHACRPSPPEIVLVLISLRDWVDPRAIVWLEGLGLMKNPVTSSGTTLRYLFLNRFWRSARFNLRAHLMISNKERRHTNSRNCCKLLSVSFLYICFVFQHKSVSISHKCLAVSHFRNKATFRWRHFCVLCRLRCRQVYF